MHAHRRQERSNRTSLLDPGDPVAEHHEPHVFDSKRREGVFALVKRDEMAHAVDRDRATEIVVLEGAVIAEGVFAEQPRLIVEDADPFVADPRDHAGGWYGGARPALRPVRLGRSFIDDGLSHGWDDLPFPCLAD